MARICARVSWPGSRHFSGWLELPQPVDLCIRARPDSRERLIFLLNDSAESQTITLHKDATDALSGAQLSGSILLEPFGVRILSD